MFPLREPKVLAPARTLDALRWKLFHRPARTPLRVGGDGGVEPRNLLSRALLSAGRLSALTRVRPASATPASSASRP